MLEHPSTIGNRIAPPRFLAFCGVLAVAVPLATLRWGWTSGTMIGFDAAAAVFLACTVPLLRTHAADAMRRAAARNDANRAVLLALTVVSTLAVLAAVGGELLARGSTSDAKATLVIATLALAWLFANTVYALHYAHVFYLARPDGGDAGGLDFPECPAPDYTDFAYFAFTLGMTFQTSDVAIRTRALRRTVTLHALAAFVFNLGVVAFTINVLGGS